jgi:hypothetical protein
MIEPPHAGSLHQEQMLVQLPMLVEALSRLIGGICTDLHE